MSRLVFAKSIVWRMGTEGTRGTCSLLAPSLHARIRGTLDKLDLDWLGRAQCQAQHFVERVRAVINDIESLHNRADYQEDLHASQVLTRTGASACANKQNSIICKQSNPFELAH